MSSTPALRAAVPALFWRVFLVTFAIQQFTAFHKTRRMLGHAGFPRKFEAFLDFTPYALVLACLVAALVAVGFDLVVRLFARPLAARWYAGRPADLERLALEFRPDTREQVLFAEPARVRRARGWAPGTLVATDTRIAFIPRGWDDESWVVERAHLTRVELEPSRAVFGSFVLGVPASLLMSNGKGEARRFAVADPDRLYRHLQVGELHVAAPIGDHRSERAEPLAHSLG